MLLFRSRFPVLSPYSRPGFPCLLSGSVYSASCLFPFVLPSFAPTAVPLVLPFWITPRGSTLGFHILSSASALASHYSASVSSFPLFPFPPHSGLRGARPFLSSLSLSPSVPPVSVLPFRFRYLSFPAVPFSASLFRVTGATLSYRPPVSSSAAPLGFRFRFRLLGLSIRTFRFASDLAYNTTRISKSQHLFCAFLNYRVAYCSQILPCYHFWNLSVNFPSLSTYTKFAFGQNRVTERKEALQTGKRLGFPVNSKRRERI